MKNQGLNRMDVAKVIGCSPQRIGHIKQGVSTISVHELAALHKANILDGHALLDEYLAA